MGDGRLNSTIFSFYLYIINFIYFIRRKYQLIFAKYVI
jgi:hypothetical protein